MFPGPRRGIFLVGTDTNVGKTYVGCLLARAIRRKGYRVGVYKPVASGFDPIAEIAESDPYRLWQAAGCPGSLELVCPQMFRAPLAPPAAARREGKRVNRTLLETGLAAWEPLCDVVLVEGVGGWFAPISDKDLVGDLARRFAYPVLIVAANRLGVINHTLLTVQAVERSGLKILGVVLNDLVPVREQDLSAASNRRYLRSFSTVPILARIGFRQKTLSASLTRQLLREIGLDSRCR